MAISIKKAEPMNELDRSRMTEQGYTIVNEAKIGRAHV